VNAEDRQRVERADAGFLIEPNIVALLLARSPSTLIERASVH
jgi:hypothetical protein